MADNELSAKLSKKGSLPPGSSPGDATEPSILLQKLKSTISKMVQNKVDSILQDVQKFSDNDKLYLYLQLPSGPSSGEKSSLDLNSLNTAEHMHACNWIRNHLEEHTDTCLPKQDVYDAYKRYCDNLCCRPLSAANFGKIIREIFPHIKARRLGGRGQSKYCYSGIRRKTVVSMPPLPSLDLKVTETLERMDLVHSCNDAVMDAACALTCDWAEKILKRSFNNIVEVAQFLIQQHLISSRSAKADLVMAMVVSESSDNIHKENQTPQTSKKNELETPDSTVKNQLQSKKESNSKASALPRAEKKKPPEAPKQVRRPQVNALVARLPLLLPRIEPGDRVMAPGAQAVRSSPPVLAPKITAAPVGGAVKVATLPLPVGTASSSLPISMAPGVNGAAGLVSQQAAVPVINMILPNVPPTVGIPAAEIPANPKSTTNGDGHSPRKTSDGQACSLQEATRIKGIKRPPEPPSEGATLRRKRGRPRKKPDEVEAPSPDKGSSVEETLSGSEEGAAPEETGGSNGLGFRASHSETAHTGSLFISGGNKGWPRPPAGETEGHHVEDQCNAKEGGSPPAASTSANHIKCKGEKASETSQVSVIQDGRSGVKAQGKAGAQDTGTEAELCIQVNPGEAGQAPEGGSSVTVAGSWDPSAGKAPFNTPLGDAKPKSLGKSPTSSLPVPPCHSPGNSTVPLNTRSPVELQLDRARSPLALERASACSDRASKDRAVTSQQRSLLPMGSRAHSPLQTAPELAPCNAKSSASHTLSARR
ncbi:DNA-binding protein RFX5 isoform X2 [Alligator mississippiensis]|uniref:DNA-binding protein RFX5 isoform X2 n=1 Tax=Alligator mississippiensis TaxID=8496 RepID=UPI002877EAF7|nr:DNA-binding protein RFX5 isoform X2 [Alligator mississippiensis]